MEPEKKNLKNKAVFSYFIILALITILINLVFPIVIDSRKILVEVLSLNFNKFQIDNYLKFQEKWQWVSYIIIPIFLFIKSIIISSILYIGTFFYGKAKITFKQLLVEVIKAEFAFLGVGVCKIIWFYFFQTNYTLEDLQYFYPLSALNIVGYQGLEPWFIYPLQVLNLFELAYWLMLAYFIGKLAFTEKDKGKPMDLGLKIVASSYGSALLLWVVVVMFFTLNYS